MLDTPPVKVIFAMISAFHMTTVPNFYGILKKGVIKPRIALEYYSEIGREIRVQGIYGDNSASINDKNEAKHVFFSPHQPVTDLISLPRYGFIYDTNYLFDEMDAVLRFNIFQFILNVENAVLDQLPFSLSPPPTAKTKAAFLKPDRLPKKFREQQCSKSRAKPLGMEMLISAASWSGNKPNPTDWHKDRFGIPFSTAAGATGTFKVEITNTDETNQ